MSYEFKELTKPKYSDRQLELVLRVCWQYEFYEQVEGWVLWECQMYQEDRSNLYLLRKEQVERLFDNDGVLLSAL